MKAFLNNKPIPLQHLTVDSLGWDHHNVKGSLDLILELDEEDLMFVGSGLFSQAQEFEAEEPGYFDDEDFEVPVPISEHMFVDDPLLIEQYIQNSTFWSHETIMLIVKRIDMLEKPDQPYKYVICDYHGLTVRGNVVELTLRIY